MDIFENKAINGYVYATRFIASWIKAGGQLRTGRDIKDFKDWLKSIGEVSEDDIHHIVFLATNGRLELEDHAKRFLTERSK